MTKIIVFIIILCIVVLFVTAIAYTTAHKTINLIQDDINKALAIRAQYDNIGTSCIERSGLWRVCVTNTKRGIVLSTRTY